MITGMTKGVGRAHAQHARGARSQTSFSPCQTSSSSSSAVPVLIPVFVFVLFFVLVFVLVLVDVDIVFLVVAPVGGSWKMLGCTDWVVGLSHLAAFVY